MTSTHGDGDLARRAAAHLGRRHERFVVAEVTPDGHGTASVGLPPGADVEIGSVSKGLTGLLFADARSRREIADSTRLAEVLPLAGTAAGEVTLGELAVHRSGLPRLASHSGAIRGTVALLARGANPYGQSLDELLASTRRTPLGKRTPRYSNLGFMLLGHAVASAAGATYAGLLAARLTGPLGMTGTTLPLGPDELGGAAVTGRSPHGRSMAAWTGEGLGPAGGVRSTADDLARLVRALLEGTAPGLVALDPVADFEGSRLRIGAAWLTAESDGRAVTWHNGGTGGFRSIVALDRAAGRGVALVSACGRSVDTAGLALLANATESRVGTAG